MLSLKKNGIIEPLKVNIEYMKKIVYILLTAMPFSSLFAKDDFDIAYRRNSLYTVMINHTEQQFADEIRNVFMDMPIPDKYNNHNLSVKILNVSEKKEVPESEITSFIASNHIPSRLVAQWFNRSMIDGSTDMETIYSRGMYSASELDKIKASKSLRGNTLLKDAGVDLIGNTFVLVNEVRYIDKEAKSKAVGTGLRVLGTLASAATGDQTYARLGNSVATITETIKGFRVKIYSHLYQLNWNEDLEMDFYMNSYSEIPDEEKAQYFENNRDKFTVNYLGCEISNGNMTSFMGIAEDEPEVMVRKACQRALDENIANLQKEYESFKVKVPLLSTEPITAHVGLKEGITKDSRFEVLEKVVNKAGEYEYKRVGVIRPLDGSIWDNRYMAIEENAYGADFGMTTFKKVSGRDFYEGMLIREIK